MPYVVAEFQLQEPQIRELLPGRRRSHVLLQALDLLPHVFKCQVRSMTEKLNTNNVIHMWNLILVHVCKSRNGRSVRLRLHGQSPQTLTAFILWERTTRREDTHDGYRAAFPSFLREQHALNTPYPPYGLGVSPRQYGPVSIPYDQPTANPFSSYAPQAPAYPGAYPGAFPPSSGQAPRNPLSPEEYISSSQRYGSGSDPYKHRARSDASSDSTSDADLRSDSNRAMVDANYYIQRQNNGRVGHNVTFQIDDKPPEKGNEGQAVQLARGSTSMESRLNRERIRELKLKIQATTASTEQPSRIASKNVDRIQDADAGAAKAKHPSKSSKVRIIKDNPSLRQIAVTNETSRRVTPYDPNQTQMSNAATTGSRGRSSSVRDVDSDALIPVLYDGSDQMHRDNATTAGSPHASSSAHDSDVDPAIFEVDDDSGIDTGRQSRVNDVLGIDEVYESTAIEEGRQPYVESVLEPGLQQDTEPNASERDAPDVDVASRPRFRMLQWTSSSSHGGDEASESSPSSSSSSRGDDEVAESSQSISTSSHRRHGVVVISSSNLSSSHGDDEVARSSSTSSTSSHRRDGDVEASSHSSQSRYEVAEASSHSSQSRYEVAEASLSSSRSSHRGDEVAESSSYNSLPSDETAQSGDGSDPEDFVDAVDFWDQIE
ncbi:MAG: hypothetical protein M1828_003855 [Chrysothrix sp. TS-e1954]|nr:MAG: hypothetical protein M1828_003855 [Chrysothrix sp. TS-e1954]